MTTIRDVAQAAGVSITTVSHVINGTRFVSDQVAADVRRAMLELGYRPNVLARGLRSGKTRTIGLIIPDNSNLFFAEVSRVIENVSFQNGYSLIICNSDDNLVKEKSYLDTLVEKQVDGIIFISAGSYSKDIEKLVQSRTPVVVVDRDFEGLPADTVLVDNQLGGYLATQYLIQLGHRHIACISGPSEVNPSADRLIGFRKALREAGLLIEEELILRGDFHYQSGERCMHQLLELNRPFSAIFVCNDMMAIGALKAAHNRNLRVPQDISIIGFDDIPIAEAISPALTTIAQPYDEMATTATNLLLEKLSQPQGNQKNKFERIVLQPHLVIRETCDFLPEK